MKIMYLKDTFDPGHEGRDEMHYILQAGKHGHKVSIATSDYNNDHVKDKTQLFRKDRHFQPKFEIFRTSSFKFPYGRFIIYLAPIKKLKKNKYDIAFVHNIGSFSSFLIPLIKLNRSTKIILKADFSKPTFFRSKQNWFYRKLILFPLRFPEQITCFSKGEMEYLIELGVPESKLTIIPVGIDFGTIPDLTGLPGSPAGRCTIGMVGRMTEQKGHHRITKQMQRILKDFPKSKFMVTGSKSDKNYAESFLSSFSGNRQFSYQGFVDNLYDFMKRCDIIITPSIYESGSILCLEAMAAGKAVIASDINPHSEYIRSGKNGFLAESPEDYYKIISDLMKKPEQIKKLGTAARKSAKKYDWENIGKDVEKIYAKLE